RRPDLGLPRRLLRAAAARARADPPDLPRAAGCREAEAPAARGRGRAGLEVRQDLVRVEAEERVLVPAELADEDGRHSCLLEPAAELLVGRGRDQRVA